MAVTSAPRRRSFGTAFLVAGGAAVVLVMPVFWYLLIGLVVWNGCWPDCTPADRWPGALALAVSALLVIDVGLWFWAGLRRFPIALLVAAFIPPAIAVIWFAVATLMGWV